MTTRYRIAFWNVENLFDIEGSPRREEKVARAIGKDIKGWTQALLDKKVSQLAAFIQTMNGGRGPDILGMSEVENRYVLELLVQALAPLKRNYAIVHHDTQDNRGIDVAFIYDSKKFSVEATFNHFIMRRNATRDILQVNFLTQEGRRLIVMGALSCHGW
jgi:predicted extracellular nuclease